MSIACCLCAKMIVPNDINMCLECLRGEVDITEKIEKEGELIQCSECFKWQIRSDGTSRFRSSNELWQEQELESIGFMGLCLKKIQGLQSKDLKLIDSSWLWTEPHSRRIKISLVVEAEVLNGKASVRQKAIVEFIIKSKKCPYCLREASEHTWGALVQVRQRTAGSKSLHALEDMIVKAGLTSLMQSITITKEGLDMYCTSKNQADTLVDFISSRMPVRVKSSKKQVSKITTEYVSIVEVAALTKLDLVPIRFKPGGRITDIMLISKISSSIHLLNPMTLRKVELKADKYFAEPLSPLLTPSDLVRFIVLDIQTVDFEPSSSSASEPASMLIDIEIARESDFGTNDKTSIARSHLGLVLKEGDIVLGYDLEHAVIDESIVADLSFSLQDVILVKKLYTHELTEKINNKKPCGGRKKGISAAMSTHDEDINFVFEIGEKEIIESDEEEEVVA